MVAVLAVRGFDYYTTPLLERARHVDYWRLKPGGSAGLFFGYLGAGMMTLLLLYSLRKRVKPLRRLGSLAKWLDWHIVMGIYGPLFIVLHSSMKVGGIVSVAFWSMLTVALSGIFGRYLYLQIPRSENGHALSLTEIQRAQEALSDSLVERKELSTDHRQALTRLEQEPLPAAGILILVPVQLTLRQLQARRTIRREIHRWGLDKNVEQQVARMAITKARLHARLLLLRQIRKLFHYWHVFHKPFAIIMYLLLVLHVAVAWTMGYGGPFG